MSESEAKRRWMKENTTIISAKLNNRLDADLVEFLKDSPSVAAEIKKALRYYKAHQKTVNAYEEKRLAKLAAKD